MAKPGSIATTIVQADMQRLNTVIAETDDFNGHQGARISDREYREVVGVAEDICRTRGQSKSCDEAATALVNFTNRYAATRHDPRRSVWSQSPQLAEMKIAEKKAVEIIRTGQLKVEVPQYYEEGRFFGNSYTQSEDPWYNLKGICGLAAMAMAQAAVNRGEPLPEVYADDNKGKNYQHDRNENVQPMFDYAHRTRQQTVTGEIFDTPQNMPAILKNYGYTGSVHDTFAGGAPTTYAETYDPNSPSRRQSIEQTTQRLIAILDKGHVPIIAIDSDAKGNPMNAMGYRSHFVIPVHNFEVNGKTYFIVKHGWAELGHESGTSGNPTEGQADLQGYYIWSAEEMVDSMMGLNDAPYYRPRDGKLVTGPQIPRNQQLDISKTVIGNNAGFAHTGKEKMSGIIIEVMPKGNTPVEGGTPFGMKK